MLVVEPPLWWTHTTDNGLEKPLTRYREVEAGKPLSQVRRCDGSPAEFSAGHSFNAVSRCVRQVTRPAKNYEIGTPRIWNHGGKPAKKVGAQTDLSLEH
jgi:hypothetical protein